MATRVRSVDPEDYYASLDELACGPLWKVLAAVMTPEPRPSDVPHLWRWRDMKPKLDQAADLVSARDAERRVLMLLNPGLPGLPATTRTLYAGLQIIRPGEVAPAHRHTPNALRLVLDGDGAFTSVAGERSRMRRGDLLTTPTMAWHDHGQLEGEPMVWLDGLDLNFVLALNAMFLERYPEEAHPVTEPDGASWTKYGHNLRPAYETFAHPYSPILKYPYEETRKVLQALRDEAGSPYDGVILQFLNPLSGGPVLPTMHCYVQLLRPGTRTRAHRHTYSAVHAVLEGRGRTIVNGQAFEWEPNDVLAVPSWHWHEHEVTGEEDAVLFTYTDEPMLRPFHLLREEAWPGPGHQE